MHAHAKPSRRGARASATASLLLTVLGTISFITGSFSDHALGSVLGLCLVFSLPAGLLFLFCMWRVQAGNLLGAIISSMTGGIIMVVAAIAAAIASAYSNPCFEIARCTRGPTFAYLAQIAAMIAFLCAAAFGLFIAPAVVGLAIHRRRTPT
jgi:hypothetical protein